jgi:hypothetical protein
MALQLADRVRETTSTVGTGAVTLGGAVSGYVTFSSVITNGNTTYYVIVTTTGSAWEVGVGTYSSGTLTRDTVLDSSNSNALVNFQAGTKYVFIAQPAGRAVYSNGTNIVAADGVPVSVAGGGTGFTSYTTGDIAYASGTTALSKLAIGTAGQVMTSTGTAPQWSTLSGIAVTTITFGSTGLTPSSATGGAVTVAGTLITTNGGTGLSSYTAGDTFYYASGTAFTKLAIGASGTIKTSTGTAPQWVASLNTSQGGTGVTSYTAGDITYYASGTALSKLGIGSSKTILTSSGTAPQWSASLDTSQGGTGLTTFTAGDLVYFASGTSFTKLGIGTNGQVLTSSGTAPQWTAASSVGVTTISFGSTGLTPSTATNGAVTVAGTLATANGGTNLTSFTSGGAVYATSTSVLTTGTLPLTAGGTGGTSVSTAQASLQVDPAGTAIAMAIALG